MLTVHFPHQNSILITSQPIIPRDIMEVVQISVLNIYILTQKKTEVLKLLAPILSSDTDYISDPGPLFPHILRYKSEFSAGSFALSASPSPPRHEPTPSKPQRITAPPKFHCYWTSALHSWTAALWQCYALKNLAWKKNPKILVRHRKDWGFSS